MIFDSILDVSFCLALWATLYVKRLPVAIIERMMMERSIFLIMKGV